MQVGVQRQVEVGERLRLDALRGVDEQDGALARRQRPRDLVGEVDVAGGVDEVEDIGRPSGPVQGSRTAWLLMVMPRSRSMSIRSRYCARICRSPTTPVSCSIRSASVDLPWSMCAMTQKLRITAGSVRPGWGAPGSGDGGTGIRQLVVGRQIVSVVGREIVQRGRPARPVSAACRVPRPAWPIRLAGPARVAHTAGWPGSRRRCGWLARSAWPGPGTRRSCRSMVACPGGCRRQPGRARLGWRPGRTRVEQGRGRAGPDLTRARGRGPRRTWLGGTPGRRLAARRCTR